MQAQWREEAPPMLKQPGRPETQHGPNPKAASNGQTRGVCPLDSRDLQAGKGEWKRE
jgi:hypothetical protein